jgi:hypothetical protein
LAHECGARFARSFGEYLNIYVAGIGAMFLAVPVGIPTGLPRSSSAEDFLFVSSLGARHPPRLRYDSR